MAWAALRAEGGALQQQAVHSSTLMWKSDEVSVIG
jgi:hypothetical protein